MYDMYIHDLGMGMYVCIVGASLSEPHTYEENGGFVCLYIRIYIYICRTSCRIFLFARLVRPSEQRHSFDCLCCLANAPAKCAKCARAAMDPTAADSTASSLSDYRRDKEESLRRRRERDRVLRASETGARRNERLRVRRERQG